jgi:hypothetical protein
MALRDKITSLYLMGKNTELEKLELQEMMHRIVQSDVDRKWQESMRSIWNKITTKLSKVLDPLQMEIVPTPLNLESNVVHDRLRENCLEAYFLSKRTETGELVKLYLSQDLETDNFNYATETFLSVWEHGVSIGTYCLQLWYLSKSAQENSKEEDEKLETPE